VAVIPSTAVRLVIADVDGTLLTPDKVLTPRARAAVHSIAEAGIAFTITSGRPPRGMKMLIDDLQLKVPITAFNGGLVLQPGLSVIQEHLIPGEAVRPCIDLLTKHGLDVWIYDHNEWRVPSRNGLHVAREEWTVGFAPEVTTTSPAVRNAATFVTSSNTEEGFVVAMEQFVLSNRSAA
jgi:hydroxymethylpyrimidine pyrophosphatase-like HAD family hydrolase